VSRLGTKNLKLTAAEANPLQQRIRITGTRPHSNTFTKLHSDPINIQSPRRSP
jgi:hypothetical protein